MEEQKEKTTSELKIISSRLAKRFKDNQEFGPCACTGLECCNPGCAIWWRSFLTSFSARDIAKMVEAYILIAGLK